MGFVEGAKLLARHRAFRSLVGLFLYARIAVDLIGAMFLLYFIHWIGREEDFSTTLFLFLTIVVLALPVWLRVAQNSDKRTVFIVGTLWWALIQLVIYFAEPGWPRWSLFVVTGLAAIGYAVADLMPWSMLGEVIDEDELATGERREGVYVGFFMFLRKLGGGIGVAGIGFALDLCGFDGALPREQQAPLALAAIRVCHLARAGRSSWCSRSPSRSAIRSTAPRTSASSRRSRAATPLARAGSAGQAGVDQGREHQLGHARVQAEGQVAAGVPGDPRLLPVPPEIADLVGGHQAIGDAGEDPAALARDLRLERERRDHAQHVAQLRLGEPVAARALLTCSGGRWR